MILFSGINTLCMNNNNKPNAPSHPMIKAFYDKELKFIPSKEKDNTKLRLYSQSLSSIFFEKPTSTTNIHTLHCYLDGEPYGSAPEAITSFLRAIKKIRQYSAPSWTCYTTATSWLESQKDNAEFQKLIQTHIESDYFQENEKNYSLGFLYELCKYESEITQKIKERAQESSSNQDEK